MKIVFSEEEEKMMKKAGVTFDVTKNLDNEAVFEIDAFISEYLMYEGIDEDETVNKEGKICQEILEKLVEE
ncbi:MAG: hypothetical protein RSB37_01565 [Acetivibrio sp.]